MRENGKQKKNAWKKTFFPNAVQAKKVGVCMFVCVCVYACINTLSCWCVFPCLFVSVTVTAVFMCVYERGEQKTRHRQIELRGVEDIKGIVSVCVRVCVCVCADDF